MALPQRIERLTPADADNPSAGAAEIRGLKAFIEDYFHIQDTVSYTVSPFDPEVTGRINVKEYPYNAKGDGVTDDGDAIIAAAVALQANGGGTLFFPPGTYRIYTEGTTYFGLASFTGLTGVSVIADGATLAIDPSRVFTASYGTMFYFEGCTNVKIDGFTTSGPVEDITSRTLKGVEFCRFTHGCHNISMPNNDIANCIGGALFVKDHADGGDLECTDIDIGILRVKNCWYGVLGSFSGSNMRIGILDADTIMRSLFIYGVQNVTANINQVDQWNTTLIKSYLGHGCQDINISLVDRPSTHAYLSRIAIEWGDQTPAVFRNISIKAHVTYGDTGDTGGPAVYIVKYDNGGNVDTADRGHILENLTISGRIDGVGSTPTFTGVIATHSSCTFGTGDFWKNIVLRDLDITNNTTQHVILQAAPITEGLLIDNVHSTADIMLMADKNLWPNIWVTQAPYTIRDSAFPNQWVTSVAVGMSIVVSTADISIPLGLGYGGHVSNLGAVATRIFWLPPATPGLHYYIRNATAAQVLQIGPDGTEIIEAGGAGKYLSLDTAYATVHLFCHVAGVWDIMSSTGTLSYQA